MANYTCRKAALQEAKFVLVKIKPIITVFIKITCVLSLRV